MEKKAIRKRRREVQEQRQRQFGPGVSSHDMRAQAAVRSEDADTRTANKKKMQQHSQMLL
jgi:hypothetical protein